MKKLLIASLLTGLCPMLSAQEMVETPAPTPEVTSIPMTVPYPPNPTAAAVAASEPDELGVISTDDLVPVEPYPIDPPDVILATAGTTTVPAEVAGDMTTLDELPAPETVDPNARTARDFQDVEVATALRLLARQAKVNMVVSSSVTGTVSMRLENTTAREAIQVIITAQGLLLDEIDGVLYVKTAAERAAEPTESGSFTLSYAKSDEVVAMLGQQFSGIVAQADQRTNTVYYRVGVSQLAAVQLFLSSLDVATKQVMIEARLVEVSANPQQNYGINWSGTLKNQTLSLGGSSLTRTDSRSNTSTRTTSQDLVGTSGTTGGSSFSMAENSSLGGANGTLTSGNTLDGTTTRSTNSTLSDSLTDTATTALDVTNTVASAAGGFLLDPSNLFSTIGGQFAILNAPQLSATLNLINEDQDSEFLANPRVVTADNQEAVIKITRLQPVPQLNFNEQTATAVFGGFEDKEFGNTLIVKPSINKDDFITLSVKPEISNKVGDAVFTFAGAVVSSPVIDTRSLDSNVLIRSGNTLAIGGLLQDESIKGSTKVPVLGDIPILGYLFQSKSKSRSKRNLLVFVTPTIIEHDMGTGLEDQVNGLHYSGEEFADPNSWKNNARGAIRLVPTPHRQVVADYPKPGTPLPPVKVRYKDSAPSRMK